MNNTTLSTEMIKREAIHVWRDVTGMSFTLITCEVDAERIQIGDKSVDFNPSDLTLSLADLSERVIEPLVRLVWEDTRARLLAETTDHETVERILIDRSKTHGSFTDNGRIASRTRTDWRNTPNWNNLLPEQQLILDELALKVARVLSTGSAHLNPEHWDDIAGYGKLGSFACTNIAGKLVRS